MVKYWGGVRGQFKIFSLLSEQFYSGERHHFVLAAFAVISLLFIFYIKSSKKDFFLEKFSLVSCIIRYKRLLWLWGATGRRLIRSAARESSNTRDSQTLCNKTYFYAKREGCTGTRIVRRYNEVSCFAYESAFSLTSVKRLGASQNCSRRSFPFTRDLPILCNAPWHGKPLIRPYPAN